MSGVSPSSIRARSRHSDRHQPDAARSGALPFASGRRQRHRVSTGRQATTALRAAGEGRHGRWGSRRSAGHLALPARRRDRAGGHGHRVPRHGSARRQLRCGQAAAQRDVGGSLLPGALPARGPCGRAAALAVHGAPDRLRTRRWPVLPGDGLRGRTLAAGRAAGRPAGRAARPAGGGDGGMRAGRGGGARGGAPRHQAGQHHARRGRRGAGAGLRHRAAGGNPNADRRRGLRGIVPIRVTGAGRGRRRPSLGHLLAGRHALPGVERVAAIQRDHAGTD